MSRGQGGPENIAIALVVGNLVYLICTLIIASFLDAPAVDLFTGPFSGSANSLVAAWVTIGGLLGFLDVLSVLAFISSVLEGI